MGTQLACLPIDTRRPRLLNPNETRLLQLLANQAAIAIEKARLHREALQRQRLEEELAVARQIQLSLLPDAYPDIPGWEMVLVYEAARLVGGDLFDLFESESGSGRWSLVVADVTGKGVPAALFMGLSRTVVRLAAQAGKRPAQVLAQVNTYILRDSRSNLFLSALYAELDVHTGALSYANGGHNRPLWWRAATGAATGDVEELAARGTILGAFDDIRLDEETIDIAPGDLVVFYTDGVTEAMDAAKREFGEGRLNSALRASAQGSVFDVADAIVGAVSAFTGNTPQSDDFTLFVMRRLP